ncbi:NAD(P)/FAD-dependent oxidoreductase [Streptomyces radicis]|uniref:NAD(P)/FAD-dependent oxidoreductase n=1 Tax=Streptomyces radicis TaxID=1750517 RepID=A0A3A9X0M6_9ACTN|nr:FAD-dependent oxidoreductase [Streptomyces radicis]RKN11997.1 NAD(P)/FAD-dependent oxidoreductase [Streptomyces radicis]RKN25952.1 NAD(P)/FAD-dependent oxidoreductase [Streptomyces radicis]
MDGTHRTFVIIGGGLAGAKAAQTLREEGFPGRVILIGDEHEQPYERPPLSKDYLTGRAVRESVFVHPPAWYAHHRIELHLGQPAVAIDRAAQEVRLGDGTRLPYDALLLATGAEPHRLGIPGTQLANVHHLRRLAHSDHLRGVLTGTAGAGEPLVIAGAGWIGLEVAAAARTLGAEVIVVEPGPTPLHGVLGPEVGAVFSELHRFHGVTFHFGTRLAEITGRDGVVAGVTTEDGRRLPARAVLAAIGAGPRTALAEGAGIALSEGGGIAVDAALRTSDPAIFAAGDVAAVAQPGGEGGRLRVEHWANALNSGPAAARSMLGHEVVYDRVPYFFSDQYDAGLEYSGWAPPGTYDRVVFRGDLAKRAFIAFWLREGRVLAGLNMNVWDVVEPIQRLVRAGRPVDPEALADPGTPLDSLVSGD